MAGYEIQKFSTVVKYSLNGMVATLIHFVTLKLCLEIIEIPSAGISNAIGSAVGISASFLGNRYFVFNERIASLHKQALRFVILYALIALWNGFFLFLWSDIFLRSYQWGFVISAVVQFVLSYFGNKLLVFKPPRNP